MVEFQMGLAPLHVPVHHTHILFQLFRTSAGQDITVNDIFGGPLRKRRESRVQTPMTAWEHWKEHAKKSLVRENGTTQRQAKWVPSKSEVIENLLVQRDKTQD